MLAKKKAKTAMVPAGGDEEFAAKPPITGFAAICSDFFHARL
jgi:hypothetical protein